MEPLNYPPSEFSLHVPGQTPPPSGGFNAPISPSVMSNKPKGRRGWILWTIIGVVLAGILGGGYFAYSRGYISIPFLSPKSSELVDKMFASLEKIENAQYSVRASFKAEPHDSKYKPFSNLNANSGVFEDIISNDSAGVLGGILALYNPDTILQILPGDVALEGGSTFFVESDVPIKDAEAQITLDGTYQGGDISVAFDVELRKVDQTVYAIVRKFPSLGGVFDLSSVKEKWIEVNPDDTEFFTDDVLESADTKAAAENLRRSVKLAIDAQVFQIGNKKGQDTIAGVRSDRYEVTLHPDKLSTLYQSLINDKRSRGDDTKQLEEFVTVLEKPEVQSFLQGVADNTAFQVWIDVTNGYLRQLEWKLVVVPPADNERLKNKQIAMNLTFTLDKVNEKVNVAKPSPTIDFDEATRLVTGISVEEQKFQKQTSRVSNVRSALQVYQDKKESYPDSLATLSTDLKELYNDCQADANSNQNANQSANLNTNAAEPAPTNGAATLFSIESIGSDLGLGDEFRCYELERYKNGLNTTDVYTENAYGYAKDGEDFRLTYEIRLSDKIDEYSRDQYAEGTNTATSKDISTEKQGQYELPPSTDSNTNQSITLEDSDQDGLYDYEEAAYSTSKSDKDTDDDGLNDYLEVKRCNTNPTKSDSDGDSYPDKTEIEGGYNPNGDGTTASTICVEALEAAQ